MSQIWLITGSSRGLGRAFTEAALAAGHSVVAGARNPDQLADLRSKFGEKIHPVSLDVASQQEPPLRLLLGSDSYNAAEKSALDKLESDRKWKDLTVSTYYSS